MGDDDITYTLGNLSDSNYITDTGSEYTINISGSTVPSSIDTLTLDTVSYSTSTIDSGNFAPTFTYDLGTDKELDILDFEEIEQMCEEYPGLKNVYEKFKHVYDLVRQDWVGKQKDVI